MTRPIRMVCSNIADLPPLSEIGLMVDDDHHLVLRIDPPPGVSDFDERLVERMAEKFRADNQLDLRENEVAMMRLRAVAEQTKIELSRRSRALVRVDEIAFTPRGKALDLQIELRCLFQEVAVLHCLIKGPS